MSKYFNKIARSCLWERNGDDFKNFYQDHIIEKRSPKQYDFCLFDGTTILIREFFKVINAYNSYNSRTIFNSFT